MLKLQEAAQLAWRPIAATGATLLIAKIVASAGKPEDEDKKEPPEGGSRALLENNAHQNFGCSIPF